MPQPTVMRTLDSGWRKAGTTMVNDPAMRYLAQQRSEQLIAEAQRRRLAAASRPARYARIRGRFVALFTRAVTTEGLTRGEDLDRGAAAELPR